MKAEYLGDDNSPFGPVRAPWDYSEGLRPQAPPFSARRSRPPRLRILDRPRISPIVPIIPSQTGGRSVPFAATGTSSFPHLTSRSSGDESVRDGGIDTHCSRARYPWFST